MNDWKAKLKEGWNDMREKFNEQFGQKLTDDDLKYQEGREDDLVNRVCQRTGKSREEVIDWINNS